MYKYIFFVFINFHLYIYPLDSRESVRDAIHRATVQQLTRPAKILLSG